MTEPAPYLSVVVTARNDDHGGNLLRRMQIFVDGWIQQTRRHNLSSELIVVEWNPPSEKKKLWEALKWPADFGCCEVRFIEVPPELHRRYAHSNSLPLYQMIAKNVGIRRARGKFVLATNIDILFSDELMRFFAARELRPDRMYRIDRHDVMSDVPANVSIDEQLAYCESHLLRVNAREGTFPLTPHGRRALAKRDIADAASGVTFGRGWYAAESWSDGDVFRWIAGEAEVYFEGAGSGKLLLSLDVECGPSAADEPVLLEVFDHDQSLAKLSISGRIEISIPITPAADGGGSIRLRVSGRSLPVENDPRILNLRVFSCRLQHASARSSKHTSAVTATSGSPLQRGFLMWRQLQGVLARVAREGPSVTVTVPPNYWRLAAFYVEWGGVTGMARNGVVSIIRRRRLRRRAKSGEDVFDIGSGVKLGLGWGRQQRLRGEVFRHGHADAEAILAPTIDWSSTLLLQIEPPAGERSFELSVKNEAGTVVARYKVSGLASLRVSIPRTPFRTEVFRFSAIRAGWKLFSCAAEQASAPQGTEPVLIPPQGRFSPFVLENETELLVCAPDNTPAPVYLQFGPEKGGVESLLVVDSSGATVANYSAPTSGVLRLALPLQASKTSVFRVRLTPSSSTLTVLRATWSKPEDSSYPQGEDEFAGPLCDARNLPRLETISPTYLHTNACGDFTLLAREKWVDIRAYPEWDLYSMNIDSVLCYAAHHGGAPEEVLPEPMRIYHIEHATGSGWTPEGEAQLFARIRAKGMSFISYPELVGWAAQMRRLNCPIIFNGEGWGLAKDSLEEVRPGAIEAAGNF